jgi:hypothetical protein
MGFHSIDVPRETSISPYNSQCDRVSLLTLRLGKIPDLGILCQPLTVNSQPSTVNRQPSIDIPRETSINPYNSQCDRVSLLTLRLGKIPDLGILCPPSTVNSQPSTVNRQPSTVNRQQLLKPKREFLQINRQRNL